MAGRDTDDDAPWLAEAAPAPRTTVSKRSLFWTLFVVLALATVAAVGLIMLMAQKDGGSTQGYMTAEQAPLIAADPGPYKIAPTDPAGMAIDGIDGTMYTAGEGIDAGSAIDQSLRPEAPLPRPGTAPAGPPRELVPEDAAATIPPATAPPTSVVSPGVPHPAAVAAPAPALTTPAAAPLAPKLAAPPKVTMPKPVIAAARPAVPAVTTVTGPQPVVVPAKLVAAPAKPGTVQLGAFASEGKANAVWATLAAKHGLSGKRITTVQSGDQMLYRLRASSADPAATCARLKAAGDACAAVE